ncbi:class I SAM-dependent methyltransferase [Methylophilus sp. 5]|uniref:class I SAM-dependent methyltransferase n=1 Tax=Methylophilus sp. 5 TaxID=1112274 RepID=UPI00056AEDF1|nr:class I SAM-dependent methyltransferase [Methylophilus sp. 5]
MILKNKIFSEVAEYYTSKITAHGDTPQGVDWNGKDGQVLRFQQLTKLIDINGEFSINDIGCGYGALYEYLLEQNSKFNYYGIDISEAMIRAAELRYRDQNNAIFSCASTPNLVADFGVASGIFNVRMENSDAEWLSYIEQTLDVLSDTSKVGFAFNCLTSYSDKDKMRDYLYYADPCQFFDLCKRKYSRHVSLIHDYGLYEFTILVRKQL